MIHESARCFLGMGVGFGLECEICLLLSGLVGGGIFRGREKTGCPYRLRYRFGRADYRLWPASSRPPLAALNKGREPALRKLCAFTHPLAAKAYP